MAIDACEYCGAEAAYDVLTDGNYIRVCERCIDETRMVIVQKPSKAQIDYSYKRPTVKQVLLRMAGIRAPSAKENVQVPSLATLRQPTNTSHIVKDRLSALAKSERREPKKIEEKKISAEELVVEDEQLDKEEYLDL